MKNPSKISLAFLVALFCPLTPVFSQTTMVKPGQEVLERANPMDIVPDENVDPRDHNPTPTPNPHDITANDGTTTGLGSPEDTQTIYDRNDTGPKERPNAYTTESRGRINYGKRTEKAVVINSAKPIKIQKTKDGSSDASESTGAFKDSLLDIGLGFTQKREANPVPSATPKADANPLSTSSKMRTSVAPKLKSRFDPTPDVDLRLGDASAEASPAPAASPSASP